MQAGGLIDHVDHFNLETADIHMKYASMITANQITVTSNSLLMEGEATLTVSGNIPNQSYLF